MGKLRTKAWISHQRVLYFREKIRKLNEKYGETVDDSLHNDLVTILKENKDEINKAYPEGSFSRLFWE